MTLGSEFRVNTYTTNNQSNAIAAMDANGDFVIAWVSYAEAAPGDDVYAQRYGYATTPVVTTTASALSYTAHSGAQDVDPNVTLTDGESTIITSATVSISSGYVSGEDVLAFTNQNGITGTFTPASGMLVLTGTATVGDYQTALESVTYTDTQADATTTARIVSISVNDGIHTSNIAPRTINPQADVVTQLVITGQPPSTVVSGNAFAFTVAAEDSANFVVTSFTGSVSGLPRSPIRAGSTLGGATVNAVAGVATFSSLTLNNVGSAATRLRGR